MAFPPLGDNEGKLVSGKILFIHGTGVRTAAYQRSMMLVADKVRTYLPRYEVVGCNWGDAFGARLNSHGQSIPGYANGRAAPATIESAAMARWTLLADDPLIELRVTELQRQLGGSRGPAVWAMLVKADTAEEPLKLLKSWGLAELWPTFVASVAADAAWSQTFQTLGGTEGQLSPLVSRAVVAAFIAWLRASGQPGMTGQQRDQLMAVLQMELGGPGLGVKDWFLGRVTNFAVPRRSALSDWSGAPLGDILRYQARGETLRNFIGERIRQTGASVILAHSLGGVAAVDWLASDNRNLAALVTVGSQAPFFYEIDALASRPYGANLPEFFPRRWLNFYDPRDFLSYAGQELFKGFAHDVKVDNGQPFPESHSAYWHNDTEVWPEIDRFLP
ncbi:hypothetical protein [Paraburkholderia hospita]|uniref:hypothetical protein n=1 Tax=Paraburkholderia hospita TaxID=169430 RepID=UPI000DEF0218|nr:hypothetical protein [Paraburkholderia hospita]AXE97337.1 hypothetical protein CUJ88_01735 [Paraburkholderia hospita]